MSKRCVWLALTAVLIALLGCSPKYRTRPLDEEEPVPTSAARQNVARADSLYSRAVEFFVAEEYDSAGYYLNRAVTYLSLDVKWSADETALVERRILLYKCRYFLERIPSAEPALPPHELELAAIVAKKTPLPPVVVVDNSSVRKWIDYFCGRGRATFVKWVNRSGQYRMTTMKILKEEGVPLAMVNLALIESGFNPNAYSRAHAVGLWQFIRSTARLYGMRVDWWVDERRDPVRSTRAAARYLRDLYVALDDWELALAAYNTGQRGVERAMKRSRSRDYWELRLPRETRDYVPKFMAACIIMDNPQAYGFEFEYDAPVEFDEIRVAAKTSLEVIARCLGAEKVTVTAMNPHLIRECAPDGDTDYAVRIPRGKVEECTLNLAAIPEDQRIASKYANPYMKHTVGRGESLSVIARKYGTSVSAIAAANGISNYHRIAAGQVLTIPYDDGAALPENPGIHVVRKGETLTSLAHLYHIRVNDIAAWNDLTSLDLIHPGQKLIVSIDKVTTRPTAAAAAPAGAGTVIHVVSKGENVSTIAARYGASCSAVLSTNGLSSRDRIYPGQKLKIPGDMPGDIVLHKVTGGDTVWDIARKYGVSASSVLEANCMSSRDRIYPGDEIKVPVNGGVGDRIIVHSVKKGETITSIARKYGASSTEVLRENGLGPRDKIYPGQKIRVPVKART